MASPSEYEAAVRAATEKAPADIGEEVVRAMSEAAVDAAEAQRRALGIGGDPPPVVKHEESPKQMRVRAAKARAHVKRSRRAA